MEKNNRDLLQNRAVQLVEVCTNYKEDETHFTNNKDFDAKIYDIEELPHLFVLACLMDRQIKAERAWEIPCIVCNELCGGDFSFAPLTKLSLDEVTNFFQEKKLHRFNSDMANVFVNAVEKIKTEYDGNAKKIWEGKNSSAEIIYRFLCFDGCGIKIASMATNLLHRIFRVEYTDYSALDISPDIHIRRVLWRLGFIEDMEDVDSVIYKARSINPAYPGLLDKCCWNVGRKYCHSTDPECLICDLRMFCPKAKHSKE